MMGLRLESVFVLLFGAPDSQGDSAGDGLVEDSAQQRRVVWDAEQVALGEADVVLPPSAHQRAQVGFVHLVADGDDKELHPGVGHLADALLQDGLGDGLRPPVGEEDQLPAAPRGVAAASQVGDGELHGLQHVGAVVLEGGLLRVVGQQGQIVGGRHLHAGGPAVLSQAHLDRGASLPVRGQETLGQAVHELLAHFEVLLADAGRAVHHQQDISAVGKRDCNTHGKETPADLSMRELSCQEELLSVFTPEK